jgi:AraC-like DNA-binding protein
MCPSITINGKSTEMTLYQQGPMQGDNPRTAFVTHYAKGKYGEIFFDELVTPDYSIQCSNIHTRQPIHLGIPPPPFKATELYANLKTDMDYAYDADMAGSGRLSKGNFAYRYLGDTGYTMYLLTGQSYELFSIRFSEEILRRFTLLAYKISFLYAKVLQDKPSLFTSARTMAISPPMLNEMNKLLAMKLGVEARDLRINSLSLCFILQSLLVVFPESALQYTVFYKEAAVQEAADLLTNELDLKYNIVGLARKVGTNDWSLKKGFKDGFGKTIKEFSMQKKLEKAIYLLLTSASPETDIAYAIGYASLPAMIKAFQNELGYAPGELRKLRGFLPVG